MKNCCFLFLLALVCNGFLVGCNNNAMEMEIIEHTVIKDLPSASGIAIIENRTFVIGDNTSWIYELNSDYKVISKIKIVEGITGVIPKNDKPDYEALEGILDNETSKLLIFGSGSKSPQRDEFVEATIINDSLKYTRHLLTTFYSTIKALPIMDDAELNIEALTSTGKFLYLFNRGKNLIFKFGYNEFKSYLKNGSIPSIEVFEFTLPEIKGIQAGFSGATIIPGSEKIIYTASVEDTPNAIDDGKILGSFIGIIDLDNLGKKNTVSYHQLIKEGKPLQVKVESVTVVNILKNSNIEVLLVTDSDGGNSEIIRGSLSIN